MQPRAQWDIAVELNSRNNRAAVVQRRDQRAPPSRFGWPLQGKPSGTERKGEDMGIIAFIILGLFAGAIAKALMPGDDPCGWIITTIIGIAGALLGLLIAVSSARCHAKTLRATTDSQFVDAQL